MVARRHVILGLLLGLGAMTSCGEDPFSASEQRALTEARARWEAAGLANYRVEVRLSCFCAATLPVFTRVEVLDGRVVSAQAIDSVPYPTDIPLAAWPTVVAGFELIAGAAGEDPYSAVEAKYDPDLGYPRRIDLECRPDVTDCGALYEFRNLEPVNSGS